MARFFLYALGTTVLLGACAPTEPPQFVRARSAEPPKLEVLVEPEAIPAFQQNLKPLPPEGDDGPEVNPHCSPGLMASGGDLWNKCFATNA